MYFKQVAMSAAIFAVGLTFAAESADEHLKNLVIAENARLQLALSKSKRPKGGKIYAKGSTLVHELELEIPASVSDDDLKKWRTLTRSQVTEGSCELKAQDSFFQRGTYELLYRYIDQNGKLLDEFVVSKLTCASNNK